MREWACAATSKASRIRTEMDVRDREWRSMLMEGICKCLLVNCIEVFVLPSFVATLCSSPRAIAVANQRSSATTIRTPARDHMKKAPFNNWERMPAGEPNRDSQLSPVSPR